MNEDPASAAPVAKRRLTALLQGRVQGVGFRFTTVEVARDYTVTGYVQNLVDGSVRLVAEGEEPDLLKFLDGLRASHVYRYVAQESLTWAPATGEYKTFVVRYA